MIVWMYRGVAVMLLFFAASFWSAMGAFYQLSLKDKNMQKQKAAAFTIALVLELVGIFVLVAAPAHAGETVRYHTFGDRTYGSDGSVTHQLGDRVYHKWPDGHVTVCHDFGSSTYCTDQ